MTAGRTFGWTLLFGLTVLLAGEYMWLYLFSRELSLDEGYLMITVRGFLQGRALYDEVFTQYGPFHYLVRAAQHDFGGLPLDHDSVRLSTLATWMAAAGLISLATARATGSAFLGWLGFLAAIGLLTPLAHEPGHPQELVALLLAGLVMLVLRAPLRWSVWLLVGAMVAALVLIKVNVGGFVALAFAALICQPFSRGPFARWLFPIALAIVPTLFMLRHIEAPWAILLALIVAAAVVLPVLSSTLPVDRSQPVLIATRESLALLAGAGLVAMLVLGFALSRGSSLAGLYGGLVTTPLALSSVVVLPPVWPWWTPVNLCVAALGCVLLPTLPAGIGCRLLAMAKVGFGLAALWLSVGEGAQRIAAIAPWLWLLLVPMPAELPRGAACAARPLLALLASWQLLQVYPIAGSQLAVASLLLIPAGVLCLHDGLVLIKAQAPFRGLALTTSTTTSVSLSVLLCAGILAVFVYGQLRIDDVRRQYRAAVPLALPGAQWVRTSPDEAAWYQVLSRFLPQEGDTFVSFPGVHSLYFWSGMQPPTLLNVTEWGLLDTRQMDAIVDALRQHRRPLVVVIAPALEDWRAAATPPNPLAAYVLERCEALGQVGPFVVLRGKQE